MALTHEQQAEALDRLQRIYPHKQPGRDYVLDASSDADVFLRWTRGSGPTLEQVMAVPTEDLPRRVQHWTKAEFWDSFTPAELSAFLDLTTVEPWRSIYGKMQSRSEFHSDSDELQAVLSNLVLSGVLTQARRDTYL